MTDKIISEEHFTKLHRIITVYIFI